MKKFFLILLVFNFEIQAQSVKKLEPISKHYKTLAKISNKAKNDSTDRQHFSLDGASPKILLRLKIKPKYLTIAGSEISIKNFPANSSEQTKSELDYLHELEKSRTPEKIEECKKFAGVFYNVNTKIGDDDYEIMQQNLFHMGRQIEGFNSKTLPFTAEMMRKAWTDCTYYFWYYKFAFNRTRPYMLDKTLKPVDTGTNFQAYPSGHASASYFAAFVYAELLPEKRDLFLQNAFEMGFSREIIGVHFPSDSEAGRVFAHQFVKFLFQNKEFLHDFEKAKIEMNEFKKNKNL